MATISDKLRAMPRKTRIAASLVTGTILFALLLAAAFPVGLLRGVAERQLSAKFGAPVVLGSLSRADIFSFTPEIIVRDLRIGQPAWAGKGDFLKLSRASARISIFNLLTGDIDPRSVHIEGLNAALVRDAEGNSNWAGRADKPREDKSGSLRLEALVIDKGQFSLHDAKRRLDLVGELSAHARDGLSVAATGTFNGSPARLTAKGGTLAGKDPEAGWPFSARLTSGLLDLGARGTTAGALNFRDMKMTMTARATSLKELDHIIEAGLFGTQDIALTGAARHVGGGWFIDRLDGTIGRSKLRARATVLKKDGRTKIDATIDAPQFDFDDLADDAGLAVARAKEARIGERVIPDTRIDLSKMGPTDGVIRFSIAELLIKGGSAFRSFKGDLTLDHRVLKLENAVATLDHGRLTGWVRVDSTRRVPTLTTELRVEGATFDTMIGQPDMIRGSLRGLIRLNGQGRTVREAFANGSGKIAFAANRGSINKTAAYVLGQNLGGAVGQKLGNDDAMAPIRCAIFAFEARGGVLRPSPFLIDTEVSRGSGRGEVHLDGETVALTLFGASKEKAALKLVDPIQVGGTLSNPAIGFDAGPKGRAGSGKSVLGAIGRSIGSALGLRKDRSAGQAPAAGSVPNCDRLMASALS